MAFPRKIPTGVQGLDTLLGGGFNPSEVTLLYGAATSGKTTLALTAAFRHLKRQGDARCVMVDSDNKLNASRFKQIADIHGAGLLERFKVHVPYSFQEQEETLEHLPQLEPVDILLLDSITGQYRAETSGEEETYQLNKELNRQLGFVSEVAKVTGCAVILTGQVRSILDANQIEPVAPRLLSYWCDTVLKLEKTPFPAQRQVTVEKPESRRGTLYLKITDRGVEDVQR